jgi:hypothetical protein
MSISYRTPPGNGWSSVTEAQARTPAPEPLPEGGRGSTNLPKVIKTSLMLRLSASTDASPAVEPETWQELAACKGKQRIMFGTHVCDTECDGSKGCVEGRREEGRFERMRQAKALCDSCVVQRQCLEWALEVRLPYGFAGGLTARERQQKLSKAKGRKRDGRTD